MEQRMDQQTIINDAMTKQNSSNIQQPDILNTNIDNFNNEQSITPSDTNYIQSEQSFGTFNMETKTIYFNGKTYEYINEQLCSDKQSLIKAYDTFNAHKINDNFPQGYSYIISLFENQILSEKTVIILSNQTNNQTTWFYFPLIKYQDLCYSIGYRVVNKKKELEKLEEFKTDNYPQGHDYCVNLINKKLNENECFHIMARKDGQKWTRYYFISKYMSIYPSEVILLQGKNQLNEELIRIKKNKVNFFPQGIEKIVEIINCQIETNKEVFFVKEKKKYFLFTS